MATEVASAYVTLLPSARGFGAGIRRQLGGDLDRAGREGGRRASGGIRAGVLGGIGKLGAPMVAAFVALGIGKIVSDAIQSEADFSKTIRQIGVAADAAAPQVDELRKLAIKMGSETTFSAGEAADAMLELAKGGIPPAVIQGGALASVMSLAAAGELGLAEAAGLTSAAMHTFKIEAAESASIADALAGGANASSADVTTLGQALTQAGSGAASAGLSLNETVGALAALADMGIQGGDAGTALKTMLSRLVPASKEAASTMKDLGLRFVDAKGSFLPITEVAEQLHTKLSGLSEAQRSTALGIIFGSDAIRAATALYDLGGKGLDKYIGATEKTGNAQKMADAAMGGTSGALEQLSGAYDTAKLALGTFLAPATIAVANALSGVFGKISATLGGLKLPDLGALFGSGGAGGLLTTLQPLIDGVKAFAASIVASFQALKGPVLGFISALIPPLQSFATGLIDTLGPGLASIGQTIQGTFVPAIAAILPVLAPVAAFLIGFIGGAVIGALKGAINVIQGVFTAISGVLNIFAGLFTGDWSRLWLGAKQLVSGIFQALVGLVQVLLNVGIIKAFRAGFAVLGGVFRAGLGLVRNLWTGGLSAISAAPGAAWALIRSLFTRGLSATATLISNGVRTYLGLWRAGLSQIASAIRAGITTAVGIVRGLPHKILTALAGLGTLLVSAGGKLIDGLMQGIRDKLGALKDTMGSVTSVIGGFLPGSPIREGPLKSWNRGGAGRRLVGLLADGLSDTGSVDAATRSLSGRIAVRAPAVALDGDSASRAGGGDTFAFGDVYAFTPDSLQAQLDERQRRRDALQPAW